MMARAGDITHYFRSISGIKKSLADCELKNHDKIKYLKDLSDIQKQNTWVHLATLGYDEN